MDHEKSNKAIVRRKIDGRNQAFDTRMVRLGHILQNLSES